VAYNIVGTVADLADTQSEVIARPRFRDFTRIAASDPVMCATYSTNRDAVLEMLGRFRGSGQIAAGSARRRRSRGWRRCSPAPGSSALDHQCRQETALLTSAARIR
jgi:prephenate dehydrogenase